MKKRICCILLCAVVLAGLIPAVALTASAAVDGMWTTYRFANDYCDDTCDHEDEPCCYCPEAGYKYTHEGFTVVPADYVNYIPRLSVMSKEAQPIKEGVYLKFRVDDYSYDGGNGADQWIALTLTTEEKVAPGTTNYGGGWMTLIRGIGNGNCAMVSYLADPSTDTFPGKFSCVGTEANTATMDDRDREIYTLEVTWDGSAYEMLLNGKPIPGSADATALLEKLDSDGEFFVGIQMYTAVKGGTAALTILQYGTTAANATIPAGSDSKAAEENYDYGYADILEPSTVPDGMPAILWSPATVDIKEGYNSHFTVLGDNTWRVQSPDNDCFFYFTPKREWSYNAEDFPVFGILLRNFWSDGGTLWYSAGDIVSLDNSYTVPVSIYDGKFYGENEEYVFIPIDLSNLWTGRIHNIRLDFAIGDEKAREFDICFAGMFRNKDEAYAYATEWLEPVCGMSGETSAYPSQDCPGAPTEPPYDPLPDTLPHEWGSIPDEAITEIVSAVEDALDTVAGETVNVQDEVAQILKKYGCAGSLSGCVLLWAAAAVVALCKRED